MFSHIVAHHKEGGADLVFPQCFKNVGGGFWNGTVVEGQVHGLLVTVHSPKSPWIEPTEEDSWLLYNHLHSQISAFVLVLTED